MAVRILIGDCRESLRSLEPNAIHTCITSPPYYALRKYPGPQLLWGDSCCDHEHVFNDAASSRRIYTEQASVHGETLIISNRAQNGQENRGAASAGEFCVHQHQFGSRCQVWRGQLGLEPNVELYVAHLVECLREVRRVLRPDGTLWLNIGDSYSGSHGNGYKQTMHKVNYTTGESENIDLARQIKREDDAKPKDLLEVPSLAALALRKDGWYLRSRIPWIKRNCMPESVEDRPTTAIEYVFLLSKSADYFYDTHAVRTETRHRRNSDWFMETWQGLLNDGDGDPLALVVNPASFKEAHYATFAAKFVEPMLKASTSEKGCCPECGSPWQRVKVHTSEVNARDRETDRDWIETKGGNESGIESLSGATYKQQWRYTGEWEPTCDHSHQPVPCTAMDCFGGAGTLGLVADRLGRNAVLCELAEDYSLMSDNRLTSDAPLFAEVETTKQETLPEFVQLGF